MIKVIVWRKSRPKVPLKLSGITSIEYESVFALTKSLVTRRCSPDATLVLCDKRHQVVLLIMRCIPSDHLPKRVFVVTPDPTDIWLNARIPAHLRDRVYLTSDPEEISYE